MGMLLAWSAGMHLLATEFQQEHERTVLRVRMQEIAGSELLIAAGGDLRSEMFTSAGQSFMERYYAQYLGDFETVFGQRYGVADNPSNYAKIAETLTRAYMGRNRGEGLVSRLKQWFKN